MYEYMNELAFNAFTNNYLTNNCELTVYTQMH